MPGPRLRAGEPGRMCDESRSEHRRKDYVGDQRHDQAERDESRQKTLVLFITCKRLNLERDREAGRAHEAEQDCEAERLILSPEAERKINRILPDNGRF